MTNIILGIATIKRPVIHVSLSRRGAGSEAGSLIDRVTPGVGLCHAETAAEPLRQTCLQAVINRIGVRQLVGDTTENCTAKGGVLRISEVVTPPRVGIAGGRRRSHSCVILISPVQEL